MKIFKYILVALHLIAGGIFFIYGLKSRWPGDLGSDVFSTILFVLAANMTGIALSLVFRKWYAVLFAGLTMFLAFPLILFSLSGLDGFTTLMATLFRAAVVLFFAIEISVIIFVNRKEEFWMHR